MKPAHQEMEKERLDHFRCLECNEIKPSRDWCTSCTATHFRKACHPEMRRLIISLKMLRSMLGITIWYWNGTHGNSFRISKESDKVAMEPCFMVKEKWEELLNGIIEKTVDSV